jgi:hypothetical protein
MASSALETAWIVAADLPSSAIAFQSDGKKFPALLIRQISSI